ncbi:nitrate/sulfonate/bicarbonate ABC transporter ATP-binding protein [Clavibacter nebraskensis]|uniref:ATP-binding cassette domain-containing protein n=2 Tax=Clavibacter nebraskensis TaxID=31963 RepID=A0A399Q0W6_9MICO|nr:nitrate/sulfonate/bicarbonate ABC transporter ATP-binding protein [Clavibacter nebraskensis]KXU21944.1 nitrate ABC transporter ATP-binding protein [Clavibacter nebraskensis]OAH18798.1 nitrate ABC transporter ATP-binding protein [Clavibacter nebraskensis]QGV65622.1 nitrate/sulfonate/bicarbonate ABC transporter ATP-binding protein [Clavibacter nebraskensis]QGV68420.1 nitrate/sulfonate/bicarbonate ABC transporter ATP-binding protein [Clavibacter nebraskensis]QGV71211.1 nitrate/sulfonate/bicarb
MTTTTRTRTELITARDVSKSFPSADGTTLDVLEHVDLTLHEGEIVALLGKSGSGKSTLLRALAGLIAPTGGEVRYRGALLDGANPGTAMVFQSFALMPWLTVLQNVELGLLAAGVGEAERRERALAAIDSIGLDGFESAYPRELSGGMRQRVGFARALVLRPDVLLMDEPFSALDVLTSENLRGEIASLWAQPGFPTRSICIVTHNIEEAVLLADRVLVLGSNPGRVKAEVPITLPRPRDRRSPTFEAAVDALYAILTDRDERSTTVSATPGPLSHPLPQASVGGLAGLVEIVHAHDGQADLPDLADELSFELDDLLPLVDAGRMLGLLEVEGAQAFLTDDGRAWVTAGILRSKELFAHLAATGAPLVRTIVKALENSDDGALRDDFFRDLLRRGFTDADAQRQLDIAIDWGRYGELFDYDADTGELVLTDVAAGLLADIRPAGEATGA